MKRRNSTPVCGAVTCLQRAFIIFLNKRVVREFCLLICKQHFSASSLAGVHRVFSVLHAACGGTRASSRAECLPTRPAVLINQKFKAGTMLGSPNSVSVRLNEPPLTFRESRIGSSKLTAPMRENNKENKWWGTVQKITTLDFFI